MKLGKGLEDALNKIAKGLGSGGTVRVGIMADKKYSDGTPVAMVAAINNFGGGAIPPRPFFTNVIETQSDEWPAALEKALKHSDGQVKPALATLGSFIAGQLRQSIADMDAPPNSPVTNLLKQRFPLASASDITFADVLKAHADVAAGISAPAGKPLVWTGTMMDSITYEVDA